MTHIFPYIFYTFCRWISKLNGSNYHCSYAANAHGLLSSLQFFNLITVIRLLLGKPPIYVLCICGVGVYVVNLFLFNDKNVIKFDKRWKDELKSLRFFKQLLVLLYVIISFVTLFYVVWNK